MNEDPDSDQGYRVGTCRLLPWRRVLRDGETLPLAGRAVSVLTILVQRAGQLVTKDELLSEVWQDAVVEENNLTTQVSALRKVLDRNAIETIPGRGYRLIAKVERIVSAAQPSAVEAHARTNLPQLPTPMVGRDAELAELEQLVARHRLVTIAGPSGIGKTRLAIDLGARLEAVFEDGVWLVALAPTLDPSLVTSAIATVLGVALRGAHAAVDTIAAAIGKKRLLLIIDNCEYKLTAVAGLLEPLLTRVPGLSVVVTSQEILRLPAEQVYRLQPLELPPPAVLDVAGFGAVVLFVERARAADRRFELNQANLAGVAEVCRRLDGIPLALEMAAARLPLLGIEGVRAGLDHRLTILKATPHGREARHHTLRAMVEWSHGLLDEGDQQLFRRLGVFSGSFSLEAAIAVAGGDADRWDIADALGRLIDKSLVAVDGGEAPRYRLLETLRFYAVEKLEASSERDSTAERHAAFFTGLLDHAEEIRESIPDSEWLDTYRPEIDNVRVALDWAMADPERFPLALALAGAAGRLWERLALLAEGRRYVDELVAVIDENTPPAAAARLLKYAGILWRSADRLRALDLMERSAVLYRQIGDRLNLGSILGVIGGVYTVLGRRGDASATLGEASALLEGSNRLKSLMNVMNELGVLCSLTDERPAALRWYGSARDLAHMVHDGVREHLILLNMAELDWGLGAVARAIDRAREAAIGLRAPDQRTYLGWALVNLSSYLILADKVAEARKYAAEALILVRDEGGYWVRLCLQQWALIGAIAGEHHAAARLVGFVDAGFARSGEVRQPVEQTVYHRIQGLLDQVLDPEDIEVYAAEGAQWPERRAVDFVIARLFARAPTEVAVNA